MWLDLWRTTITSKPPLPAYLELQNQWPFFRYKIIIFHGQFSNILCIFNRYCNLYTHLLDSPVDWQVCYRHHIAWWSMLQTWTPDVNSSMLRARTCDKVDQNSHQIHPKIGQISVMWYLGTLKDELLCCTRWKWCIFILKMMHLYIKWCISIL